MMGAELIARMEFIPKPSPPMTSLVRRQSPLRESKSSHIGENPAPAAARTPLYSARLDF